MSVAALSLFLSKMIPFGTWVHARASTNHHTRFNLRSRGRGARWPVLSLWDRAKQLCNLKRRPWFHTASSPRAESGPIPLHFMDFVSIQSSLGIPGHTLSSLYGGEVARFVAGGPHLWCSSVWLPRAPRKQGIALYYIFRSLVRRDTIICAQQESEREGIFLVATT